MCVYCIVLLIYLNPVQLIFQVGLRSGTYIAEIARTRLKYDEAKTKLSDLKHKLANVEEQMIPGQNEMDKDRYVRGNKNIR